MTTYRGLADVSALGLVFISSAALAAGAPASAPPLASHRAVYELSLLSSNGAHAPSAARGTIAFDFSGNKCDGYVQNFRQFTEIQPAEGPTRSSNMLAATYEDGDARNFRFKVETGQNVGGGDQTDGRAVKSGDGAVSISLSRPKRAKLDLDQDIVFPTEHINRILDAARAGSNLLQLKTYDGSDSGEQIFETTSIIGKPHTGEVGDKAAKLNELRDMRRWPVSISYFQEGKKDAVPRYIMSFDLYENGVSRELKLDYGDFVLKGEMKELELLPTKGCEKP